MTTFKAIKMKALHYPEEQLKKRLAGRMMKTPSLNVQQACLLKYFPKYYNHLKGEILKEKSRPLISKLRHIKVLKSFVCPWFGKSHEIKSFAYVKKFEEKIFRNKRKSIKSLPLIGSPVQYQNLEIKHRTNVFFPQVKVLDFERLPQFGNLRNKEKFKNYDKKIIKQYGSFCKAFGSVKHLILSNTCPYFGLLLQKINSLPHLLSSLETLEFFFSLRNTDDPKETFQMFSRNRNFLKHITHLNISGFDGFELHHAELLNLLFAECTKLTCLTLPSRLAAPDKKKDQALSLPNKPLALKIVLHSDLKTFCNTFSISPAIEKLYLTFPEDWRGASWAQFFDSEIQDLRNKHFVEIWKEKFYGLHSLSMELPIINQSNSSLEKLIAPLFQALPSLKAFKCEIKDTKKHNDVDLDDGSLPNDILDLSLFLDCIEEKKELKAFEINYEEDEEPILDPRSTVKFKPNKKYELPESLKRVSLCFKFFGDFAWKKFFEIFLVKNQPIKYLKLSMIYFDFPGDFDGFLKLVNESIKSDDLKVDLGITFYAENIDEILSYFTEKIVLKTQIVAKLDIILKHSLNRIPNLILTEEIKERLKEIFGDFQYNLVEMKLIPPCHTVHYRIQSVHPRLYS